MKKFNYDLTVTAASEAQADTKMRALTLLASKLSAKELEKLADLVQNDPVKLAMAKKALGV